MRSLNSIINGIKPQGKPWTLFSGASPGELNHNFSSAVAEREGGLKITGDGSHTLFVPDLNEHYHSTYGAVQESRHVFIENGFNITGKSPVRLLEVGFGTGLNAFMTAIESVKTCRTTYYNAIEKQPLAEKLTCKLNYPDIIADGDRSLFDMIHMAQWGSEERINEHFYISKTHADLLSIKLAGAYDLVYFDAFAPDKQPDLWSENVILSIASVTVKGGLFVTYSASGALKRNLQTAGFQVTHPDGPPGKRQITRAVKL
ncbi:MAG TPA: tRNA (5-methylaminomethyl-2-thiouridine)(34)-methyltransferase MnmD [Bacteroidales bacterium]|nr:tRNA (5-methylaminomethyl-2-thiouridine)(34)-methyltransferase MnmD [Bacteroidales bacterium]